MQKISTSEKIYVSVSKIPDSGRGVFAKENIKKGEIIEKCPVILLPKNDFSNINESFLVTYFYSFGEDKDQLALALGFGSIYNHTYTPNATYRKLKNEEVMEFKAIKNIRKDEEITVNYNNGDPDDKTPLWFE
jgi:uncharacterized protein